MKDIKLCNVIQYPNIISDIQSNEETKIYDLNDCYLLPNYIIIKYNNNSLISYLLNLNNSDNNYISRQISDQVILCCVSRYKDFCFYINNDYNVKCLIYDCNGCLLSNLLVSSDLSDYMANCPEDHIIMTFIDNLSTLIISTNSTIVMITMIINENDINISNTSINNIDNHLQLINHTTLPNNFITYEQYMYKRITNISIWNNEYNNYLITSNDNWIFVIPLVITINPSDQSNQLIELDLSLSTFLTTCHKSDIASLSIGSDIWMSIDLSGMIVIWTDKTIHTNKESRRKSIRTKHKKINKSIDIQPLAIYPNICVHGVNYIHTIRSGIWMSDNNGHIYLYNYTSNQLILKQIKYLKQFNGLTTTSFNYLSTDYGYIFTCLDRHSGQIVRYELSNELNIYLSNYLTNYHSIELINDSISINNRLTIHKTRISHCINLSNQSILILLSIYPSEIIIYDLSIGNHVDSYKVPGSKTITSTDLKCLTNRSIEINNTEDSYIDSKLDMKRQDSTISISNRLIRNKSTNKTIHQLERNISMNRQINTITENKLIRQSSNQSTSNGMIKQKSAVMSSLMTNYNINDKIVRQSSNAIVKQSSASQKITKQASNSMRRINTNDKQLDKHIDEPVDSNTSGSNLNDNELTKNDVYRLLLGCHDGSLLIYQLTIYSNKIVKSTNDSGFNTDNKADGHMDTLDSHNRNVDNDVDIFEILDKSKETHSPSYLSININNTKSNYLINNIDLHLQSTYLNIHLPISNIFTTNHYTCISYCNIYLSVISIDKVIDKPIDKNEENKTHIDKRKNTLDNKLIKTKVEKPTNRLIDKRVNKPLITNSDSYINNKIVSKVDVHELNNFNLTEICDKMEITDISILTSINNITSNYLVIHSNKTIRLFDYTTNLCVILLDKLIDNDIVISKVWSNNQVVGAIDQINGFVVTNDFTIYLLSGDLNKLLINKSMNLSMKSANYSNLNNFVTGYSLYVSNLLDIFVVLWTNRRIVIITIDSQTDSFINNEPIKYLLDHTIQDSKIYVINSTITSVVITMQKYLINYMISLSNGDILVYNKEISINNSNHSI